ncbi:hypothetical protein KP509_14G053000 [Ceratopteris richardii]|uniref:Uncharacterized protein n=1 Tax=Ceratopteris richardii TaxID=49495 RepID=A0A8T2TCQ0_CERRI|nr:hypothetical protein KP509_14G053000 [Ceratopteris richardii]
MENTLLARRDSFYSSSEVPLKQQARSLCADASAREWHDEHGNDDCEAESKLDVFADQCNHLTPAASHESFEDSLIRFEILKQRSLSQANVLISGRNALYTMERSGDTSVLDTNASKIAPEDECIYSDSRPPDSAPCVKDNYDKESHCHGISENMGASPSAPPMMGSVSIDSEDESVVGPSFSHTTIQSDASPMHCGSPAKLQESHKANAEACFSSERVERNIMDIEESVSRAQEKLNPPICLSGHGPLHILVAYDACVRLCLRAWAKGCIEASEFLADECLLLRKSFGLQQLLLQPQEGSVQSITDSHASSCVGAVNKTKGSAGRIKVQVRKLRIFPCQGIYGSYSIRSSSAYIQAGAQYVRQVSEVVRAGMKNLLATSSIDLQGTSDIYSCLLWLKSAINEEGVLAHPGSGDMHVFNLDSSSDSLLLEVQNSRGSIIGRCAVRISSLIDDLHDHVRWWPVFSNQDHECIGKVQLFISYSASSSEDSSKKWGPLGEALAYDIVMEVAMRAQHFQQRNLRLHGPWKWLLSEFAVFYGVPNVYVTLRYLMCIMEVATPTEDCLALVYELLSPLINAQDETTLTRQEKRMLSDMICQVDRLLASVFENHKLLDESSVSGISETVNRSTVTAAPALLPAVQLFTLLHDILSVEAEKTLSDYFQRAARKMCRRHMAETDEFVSNGTEGFLVDPITTATAYSKLQALCGSMCTEIQGDIELHNQHILPSCIDLPNITADVYCKELSERLRSFLLALPPSGPFPHVVELLKATAEFQNCLTAWKINPTKHRVDAKDLFHLYVVLWIQERRLSLLDLCKADKIRWTGVGTSSDTSCFVEEMYDRIKDTLNDYNSLLNYWPEYTLNLESAIADVETAVVMALEKQNGDVLAPLKDVMLPKKFSLQYMQKLTRRRSLTLYHVPIQLGTFLNTIKRLLDVLRPKIDAQMKGWVACIPNLVANKLGYGERSNEVTIFLRAKYKNFIQAIVEKLADNARLQSTTKVKKILQDISESGGESDIRDRMQPLRQHLSDTIKHLHDVFTPRVFVAICRGYWDRMGQDVLHFLENRKENRIWYKGFHYALMILDDIFASQMQKLEGHCLQEKDLDPPRSIFEARSMLSRDVPNSLDSSEYSCY